MTVDVRSPYGGEMTAFERETPTEPFQSATEKNPKHTDKERYYRCETTVKLR